MKPLVTTLIFVASTLFLASCKPAVEAPAVKPDRYDVGQMDLKPTPAVVTTERHSGAFRAAVH